jgi:hypothetical protein
MITKDKAEIAQIVRMASRKRRTMKDSMTAF